MALNYFKSKDGRHFHFFDDETQMAVALAFAHATREFGPKVVLCVPVRWAGPWDTRVVGYRDLDRIMASQGDDDGGGTGVRDECARRLRWVSQKRMAS